VPDGALRWSPGFRQAQLRDLLANELDRPWTGGPYGERSRALIRKSVSGIEELFRRHDHFLERLIASDDRWVMTHGEPHGGNTMIDAAGQMHLVDCDDMMLAPRERDIWLLLYVDHQRPAGLDNSGVIEAYRRWAGPVEPRDYVLELYRADWHLREISAYGVQFSGAHEDTEDIRAHWRTLNSYLPTARNWPRISA
jgi:spectinomycin phosphotransferase